MPRPPDPEALIALAEYVHGTPTPTPDGMCWDTRIAQRNTPEALRLQLEAWEVVGCDTMPRTDGEAGPVLDQIIHFRKRVPVKTLLARAERLISITGAKLLGGQGHGSEAP